MRNYPTIYTFGDSHCWHAWLKVPNVVTNCGGAMTMYSFGLADQSPITETQVPLDSIIVFSLGEIDCRYYVNKYQPWQKTIESLVEGYIRGIDICVTGRNLKLVWIFNVLPPIKDAGESPTFPFVGTLEERASYVKYMNGLLRKSKYTFVDIYDACSTSEGFMKPEDSDMHVHLENEKYIIEWIEKHGSLFTQSQ